MSEKGYNLRNEIIAVVVIAGLGIAGVRACAEVVDPVVDEIKLEINGES